MKSGILECSSRKILADSIFFNAEINQLYRPSAHYTPGQFTLIYSYGLLNTTKFDLILLYEWFSLCSPGSSMVVDYQPNSMQSGQNLESNLWYLFQGTYDINFHDVYSNTSENDDTSLDIFKFIEKSQRIKQERIHKTLKFSRLVITKIVDKKPASNINEWSFGIITDGNSPEKIREFVASVRKQKIPSYEILICGPYVVSTDDFDIKVIELKKRENSAWITKKKNLLIEMSKFQNVMIVHDRIYLSEQWFQGMKKWGDNFEVLAVPQILKKTGRLLPCWAHYKFDLKTLYRWNVPIGLMDFKDWGKHMLDCGPVLIAKKHILLSHPFNESLYWGEFEDCELSKQLVDHGYLFRINPNAFVYSSSSTLVAIVERRYIYNNQRLGALVIRPTSVFCIYKILDFFGFRRNSRMLQPCINYMLIQVKKFKGVVTHKDR
jgi:hypothetical protein